MSSNSLNIVIFANEIEKIFIMFILLVLLTRALKSHGGWGSNKLWGKSLEKIKKLRKRVTRKNSLNHLNYRLEDVPRRKEYISTSG